MFSGKPSSVGMQYCARLADSAVPGQEVGSLWEDNMAFAVTRDFFYGQFRLRQAIQINGDEDEILLDGALEEIRSVAMTQKLTVQQFAEVVRGALTRHQLTIIKL
jgi:hypothetical protein